MHIVTKTESGMEELARSGKLAETLLKKLDALAGGKVLIVGDCMLDKYVAGNVERISPEAPVPVLKVEREWHLLGGAGNVARNVADLGGKPYLLTVTGEDGAGDTLAGLLRDYRVELGLVRTPERPTTVKTRIIAVNQQVCRVDHEDDRPLDGATLERLGALLAERLSEFPVVIVSDYGKGVVTARLMETLRAAARSMANPPMIMVDPKTRNYDLYTGVDIITPNTKEAGEGAGLKPVGREGILAAADALFRRLQLRHLLITLGPEGMALFERRDHALHIPTFARKVYDVTGAGDTVIATLGLSVASGLSLIESCVLANYAAGIVVGQVGTATANLEQLREAINSLPKPEARLWLNHGAS